MSPEIDLDTALVPSDRVLCRELDREAVLLDLDSGRYYGLDPVGTRIWSLLEEHGRLRDVLARLRDEYDVDDDRLRRDLLELVRELEGRGLVRRRAGDGARDASPPVR